MEKPALVLDANVLTDKRFLGWLRRYRGRKILPIVAFVEVGVHFRLQERLDDLRGLLASASVEIEWMRISEAESAIASAAKVGDFADNARDHIIGAHAAVAGRVFVTRNVRDFSHLAAVRTPEQAMRDFG